MSTEAILSQFAFNGHGVRVLGTPEKPLFVAKDVCAILGLANNRRALMELDADEKGVTMSNTLGGNQKLQVVTEQGLYRLIFKSQWPRAFQKWVFAEVLPMIRNYGQYIFPVVERSQEQILLDMQTKMGTFLVDAAAAKIRIGRFAYDFERGVLKIRQAKDGAALATAEQFWSKLCTAMGKAAAAGETVGGRLRVWLDEANAQQWQWEGSTTELRSDLAGLGLENLRTANWLGRMLAEIAENDNGCVKHHHTSTKNLWTIASDKDLVAAGGGQ